MMMYQAVSMIISASIAYVLFGWLASQAAWFGGVVALTNAMLLRWRMRKGAQAPVLEPRMELARIVRSSLERFFLVVLLLAVGLVWLKLQPVPMLSGFALGQLALVISTINSGIEK